MSVDADCSAGSPTEPFCAHEWAREAIVACAALGQRRSQQFSTRADDVFFGDCQLLKQRDDSVKE